MLREEGGKEKEGGRGKRKSTSEKDVLLYVCLS
jgi:hypothetical protein